MREQKKNQMFMEHYGRPFMRPAIQNVKPEFSKAFAKKLLATFEKAFPQFKRITSQRRTRRDLLVTVDMGAIERRLLARYAAPCHVKNFRVIQDEFAKDFKFATDKDFHRATAAKMFNVRYEDVTPEMRRAAKRDNFWKLYGPGDAAYSGKAPEDIVRF